MKLFKIDQELSGAKIYGIVILASDKSNKNIQWEKHVGLFFTISIVVIFQLFEEFLL